MKKIFLLVVLVFGFISCSDPAKEAEIVTLEKEVTGLQGVISRTKDSLAAAEEKERALKKELDSLDMVR